MPGTTHLATVGQHHKFLLVLLSRTCAPDAEALELIDKFIYDIPEPLIRKLELNRAIGVFSKLVGMIEGEIMERNVLRR